VRRWARAPLLALALALSACSSTNFNRELFGATQGALAALRRAEPGLLDPDVIRDATRAAAEGFSGGLRVTPEAQSDVDALVARVLGAVDATLVPMVRALVAQLREALVALLGDAQGPLLRLTRAEMAAVRSELRGALQDLDEGLQLVIQHNVRALAVEVRTSLGPAIEEAVVGALARGGRAAGTNVSVGLGRGIRQEVVPALRDAEGALLGRDRDASTSDREWAWRIAAGLIALAVGARLLSQSRRYQDRLLEELVRLRHGDTGDKP